MIGWANTGSLMVARDAEIWTQTLRFAQLLDQVGTIPYQLYFGNGYEFANKRIKPLSAVRSDLHTFLDLTMGGQESDHADVLGCLHLPMDGIVNPADACLAVASRAKKAGAAIVEGCAVETILPGEPVDETTLSLRFVSGVRLEDGVDIYCDHVIIACGQWTRQLARTAGIDVPVAIVPHQYAVFDKVEGVDNTLPVIRDYVGRTYIKPEVGGFAVGTFESPHREMPALCTDRNLGRVTVPRDAAHELFDELPMEKMGDGLDAAMTLVPSLGQVGLKT